MQWLSLVSEDAGLQRLRAADRTPARTGRLDAVTRYPSAHPVQIGEQPRERLSAAGDRRRGERRSGERRAQQLPVCFDTRSKHDRRGAQDRRQAGGEDAPARTGIDVHA